MTLSAAVASPFDLADDASYREWRARKLATAPASSDELVVEVTDPLRLTAAERSAIVERCARANMAVYATAPRADHGSDVPRSIGTQLGLRTLDVNYLADDDGITPLAANASGPRSSYIPYTNRAIRWHTDGYYNPPERRIRAMILHCVERAETGGENRVFDHELAYIALRDSDPALVVALMQDDAMTIPARSEEGDVARGDQSGPVFSVVDGHLHMRYTARTRSIAWKDDAVVHAATAHLLQLLDHDPRVLRLRLAPGMGIVCNNVLHDRAAFTDSDAHRRLVLRARYYERVQAAA
ncbi:MAG TPA: TauD/TfdA family dioxygenase [Burkholderiaceae bacterium]|nr:TauD/TfdA family dioxygenase [Burkholderiaceae bacterium]